MFKKNRQLNPRNSKIILIALLVLLLVGLHYLVSQDHSKVHIFLNMVHFIPLILAGFWFGLRGALIVWGGFTLVYSPYVWLNLYQSTGELYEQILYSVLFLIVALLLGYLSDQAKKNEEEKRQMARLAAMGESISFISHEMKSPMIAIGGFTRQVRDKVNDKKLKEKMDIVLKEITRLENLIKNMLDFAGPVRIQPSAESISQIMKEIMPILQKYSGEKNIHLRIEMPEGLPVLSCDAAKIKQVLLNLAINAIEASTDENMVRIQLRQEKDFIISEIADHGPGFPEKDFGEIFSPFYSTKKEGTGLGLAISKKIVEAHGGEIRIQNNQPRGCIVQCRLPIKQNASAFDRGNSKTI